MSNPRKPTRTKIIQGTFRKDQAPKNEPKPPEISDEPKPPAYLPTYGKKLWKRLVPQLRDLGLLAELYLPALEMTCLNYGIVVENWRVIKGSKRELPTGQVLKGMHAYLWGNNSQTIPELIAMQKGMAAFKGFLALFGMSPSDMSGIDLPELPKTADPMEKLLDEG